MGVEPVLFHDYKSPFLIISHFVFFPLLLLSLAPICLIQEEFVRSFYLFFSSANRTSSSFGEIFRNLTAEVGLRKYGFTLYPGLTLFV
jgi:hypothetical protein